jgi:hypothetical protein
MMSSFAFLPPTATYTSTPAVRGPRPAQHIPRYMPIIALALEVGSRPVIDQQTVGKPQPKNEKAINRRVSSVFMGL